MGQITETQLKKEVPAWNQNLKTGSGSTALVIIKQLF